MAKKSTGRVNRKVPRKGRRVQRRQSRQPELPLGVMAALQQDMQSAVGFRPFELGTEARVREDIANIISGRPLRGAFGPA